MFTLITYHYENYDALARLTLPNRDKYCEKHGYKHIVQSKPYKNDNRYYAIHRLELLRDLMLEQANQESSYFWVLNIQSYIMNSDIKLESFIDDEHDFYVHKDVNGLNAGSFIVRNTPWSRDWIKFVIDKAPHINHCWHEQKVMQDFHDQDPWKEKIKIMDHPGINSYLYRLYNWPETTPGNYHKGDFVISLPGTNLQQRIDLIKSNEIQGQAT